MRTDYEHVVVGLGGLGSATAYWLARAGADVLGLEQFRIGHDNGASQDHSRMIRRSYHTPGYVELAEHAYRSWAALESDLGEALLVRTGGLDLWPPGAAIPIEDYVEAMTACDVAFERIDASEISARWPQFEVADGTVGIYQADGGLVPAARCNQAHLDLARAYGATLLENAPVDLIRDVGDELEVHAAGSVYRCRRVVLATDAWTNELLAGLGLRLPLTVTQEQVTYFSSPRVEDFMPDRFPVWIWMDEPSFYGLPVYGEQGPKVGQDVGGRVVTTGSRDFETDEAALERVTGFLRRHIPSALGPVIRTKSCLYTMAPDRDFVIDALPGHPGILLALGSAHGFKFASLIGRVITRLARGEEPGHDLSAFSINRPILKEANPKSSFIV